jgi:hypothetical protein
MVIRKSFASRGSERREWLRNGQTRIGTTLLMVCLSLACHYPEERSLCVWFWLGEIGELPLEVSLLTEDHHSDLLGSPVRPVLGRVLVHLVFVLVVMVGSVSLVVVQVVHVLSLVVLHSLDVLLLVINTSLGEVAALSLRGATNHDLPFMVLILL